MDVREFLLKLPYNHWRDEEQMRAGDCYPLYVRAAEAIKPRRVLEFGTFQGFGLVSFLVGWPSIEEFTWVDDESYLVGTNAHAHDNITYAARELGVRPPEMVWYGDREQLQLPCGVDLVHVDGDHSKAGCMMDTLLAFVARPRVVLVDDYYFVDAVKEAVDVVARVTGREFFVWDTLRGWAVFTDDVLAIRAPAGER